MVTLTPITTPEKLAEYYRFRHTIYSESRLNGVLDPAEEIDQDEHDDHAWHNGWYMNGKLAGCERMIPIQSHTPYVCHGIRDGAAEAAIRAYIGRSHAAGHLLAESSRMCIHPDHRSPGTMKAFVLALVANAHGRGIDHGLFTVAKAHAAFYLRMGFDLVPGAREFQLQGVPDLITCIAFNYERVRGVNRLELEQLNTVPLAHQLQIN